MTSATDHSAYKVDALPQIFDGIEAACFDAYLQLGRLKRLFGSAPSAWVFRYFFIPRGDDDPDRVAIYAGPKTPSAVFDTFDGSVEFNAPRTTTLGTSGTADAVNTPVRVRAVWDNAGDLMILWHEVISFFL